MDLKGDEKWTLVLGGVSITEMTRALQGTEWEDHWIDHATKIFGTRGLYDVRLPMPDMDRLAKAITVIRGNVCPQFRFCLECDIGVRISRRRDGELTRGEIPAEV